MAKKVATQTVRKISNEVDRKIAEAKSKEGGAEALEVAAIVKDGEEKKKTLADTMALLPKGKDEPKVDPPKVDPSIIEAVSKLPVPLANKRTFIVGEGGQPKSIWIQAPKEDTDSVRIDLLKIQMGCKTQKDLGRALIDLAYKVHGITK